MFTPITDNEKYAFLNETSYSFIPGYTGHCPTLRFHYGKGYGTKTKEILQDLRDKGVYNEVARHRYREDDPGKVILTPIERKKGQTKDFALDALNKSPKCILGYTGFIPTLNFRYGKSFSRAADDSISDFNLNQRRLQESRSELERLFRAKSAPRLTSIRRKDEVARNLHDYEETIRYREKEISPEFPPIAGYTGHIPRVKGNEQSLSQRYNTVVKRGLTILKEERQKHNELKDASVKISEILEDGKFKYIYNDV